MFFQSFYGGRLSFKYEILPHSFKFWLYLGISLSKSYNILYGFVNFELWDFHGSMPPILVGMKDQKWCHYEEST